MTKGITVKKNAKPPKKTKPKPKPKQNEKQNEKQTQQQSITVNIGTSVSKKRGRPKRAQPVKQATKQTQPIVSPSFQSFNQPIFKQPIQQPSSLTSSILATQEKPKVVAEERKEQSSLIKALVEQNTEPEKPETQKNDLERVRAKRVEKFEVKPSEAVVDVKKLMKSEEPIRHALLGQLLAEPQDDTEEIARLTPKPKTKDIPFNTIDITTQTALSSNPLSRLPPITPTSNLFTLSSIEPLPSLYALKRYQQKKRLEANLISKQFQQLEQQLEAEEPPEPEPESTFYDVEEETPPEVLKQVQERGPAELVTEAPSEPTPLSQPTIELGFGGLAEEPIQTNVGQILPPEPISQGALEVKEEKKKKTKTILKPIEPPPAITAPQETAPTILQNVRAPDQYVTEQLVKGEPPGAPLAAAEIIEPPSRIPSELIQIEAKWKELQKAGVITSKRTGDSGTRRTKEDLLGEIQSFETWEPIKKPNKPGPQPKLKVAVATLITDD